MTKGSFKKNVSLLVKACDFISNLTILVILFPNGGDDSYDDAVGGDVIYDDDSDMVCVIWYNCMHSSRN